MQTLQNDVRGELAAHGPRRDLFDGALSRFLFAARPKVETQIESVRSLLEATANDGCYLTFREQLLLSAATVQPVANEFATKVRATGTLALRRRAWRLALLGSFPGLL